MSAEYDEFVRAKAAVEGWPSPRNIVALSLAGLDFVSALLEERAAATPSLQENDKGTER